MNNLSDSQPQIAITISEQENKKGLAVNNNVVPHIFDASVDIEGVILCVVISCMRDSEKFTLHSFHVITSDGFRFDIALVPVYRATLNVRINLIKLFQYI